MTRQPWWGLWAALVGMLPFSVAAGQDVVVVSAAVGQPPAGELAARVAAELSSRGTTVATPATVRARLGLDPFQPAPDALAAELERASEIVVRHAANGEAAQAFSIGTPVIERAQEHLAAIGRSPEASRHLANLCLFLVRVDLDANGEDAARARAMRCWASLPDLPADEILHPPWVRPHVQRARDEIDAGSTVLVVRAPPGEEEGCAVRLNGREIGRTPVARRAVVGGRYALQVECGAGPSPVRTIEVSEGSTEQVIVRPRLEEALQLGETGPALVYDTPEEARERAASDAGALAAAVGAQEALAVVSIGGDPHLYRVRVEPTGATRALADASVAGDEALRPALDRLMSASAGTGAPTGAAGAAITTETDTSRSIVGPVLLGAAGLAGLGVLTVGLLRAGCAEENASGDCIDERKVDTVPAVLYGGLGAAAVIGAVLWLALGGSSASDEDTERLAVGITPTHVDVRVSF